MSRARARKPRRSERGGGLLRLIVTVAILAWLIRSLLFAPFSIASGSMLPALYVGDYLIVAKWPYGYSRHSFPFQFPSFDGRIPSKLPERGDIVVFIPPGQDGVDYVKRVIALPGDRIEVRDGRVILNGKALAQGRERALAVPISANSPCRAIAGTTPRVAGAGDTRTCLYRSYRETLPDGASYRIFDQVNGTIADNYPAVTVPAGHVFLMGDNRDDSLDSRFDPSQGGIGLVPLDNIVGRASVIFWSTDGSSSYAKPWTWFSALRTDRLGGSLGAARDE